MGGIEALLSQDEYGRFFKHGGGGITGLLEYLQTTPGNDSDQLSSNFWISKARKALLALVTKVDENRIPVPDFDGILSELSSKKSIPKFTTLLGSAERRSLFLLHTLFDTDIDSLIQEESMIEYFKNDKGPLQGISEWLKTHSDDFVHMVKVRKVLDGMHSTDRDIIIARYGGSVFKVCSNPNVFNCFKNQGTVETCFTELSAAKNLLSLHDSLLNSNLKA